jgi:hypothetical protein
MRSALRLGGRHRLRRSFAITARAEIIESRCWINFSHWLMNSGDSRVVIPAQALCCVIQRHRPVFVCLCASRGARWFVWAQCRNRTMVLGSLKRDSTQMAEDARGTRRCSRAVATLVRHSWVACDACLRRQAMRSRRDTPRATQAHPSRPVG